MTLNNETLLSTDIIPLSKYNSIEITLYHKPDNEVSNMAYKLYVMAVNLKTQQFKLITSMYDNNLNIVIEQKNKILDSLSILSYNE